MSEGKSKDARKTHIEPLFLLEDEPVRDHNTDELTLLPFAKAIAGAAIGTNGPFTIGVFANWGQGKTSVLRQAKSLIDDAGDPNVVTVWFNAWQYEKEEHPIIPLIATIANEVERRGKSKAGSMWAKLHAALSGLAYGFSGKINLGIASSSISGKDAINKEAEALQTPEDRLKQQSLYYQSFDALAKFAKDIKGQHPKIIVFIDNLDRCLPPQALALLENIKLVLAQRGFIFAMAVDRRILESFLTKRYKDKFGMEDYGDGVSYLDKIVQLPLNLPSHQSRFEDKYIPGLLERDTFKNSNPEIKKALQNLKELLAIGSNYNPRSLVRFINNLIIDRHLMRTLDIPVDEEVLSICAVSRFLQQHLGFLLYQRISGSQALCERLREVIDKGSETLAELDAKGAMDHDTSILKAIHAKIDKNAFLREIFETVAGEAWLGNEDQRKQVNEFLSTQREEATVPADQETLVDRAIKEALGKEIDGRASEEDRQGITNLELSFSEISDAGLAHLKGLSGLQELYLNNTQISDAGAEELESALPQCSISL